MLNKIRNFAKTKIAGVFVGTDSMSRAAGVPTYLADIMLATALLLMVVAVLLTKFRIMRD